MSIVQNRGNPEIEDPVPTINEVDQAIQKLKNNEAPGMDLIKAELVKLAGPEYVISNNSQDMDK
jgi:hypothetical protein